MPGFIVLMTERRTAFGESRVLAFGRSGKPVSRIDQAQVWLSQETAQRDIASDGRLGKWSRDGWLLTVAPADGPGVPALPWQVGTTVTSEAREGG